MHGLRLLPATLLMLAACDAPDYSPVRDWASTASFAVDYPRIAGAPQGDAAILAMQQAMSVYLLAIATLASDGVLPYREDPFTELATTVRPASERGSAAITALGTLLRRASRSADQAPDLRDNIVAADPHVQALVGSLALAVSAGAGADAAAREDAAAGYARLAAETRDPVARQLVRTRAAERDTELAARQAARLQYGYILTRIGEGHALLTARAATITKDEAVQRIRAAQDELRRNAATIPRGWPG
ncbi:MAG: hypothetical protein WCP77_00670 [Roseococcus sp.]